MTIPALSGTAGVVHIDDHAPRGSDVAHSLLSDKSYFLTPFDRETTTQRALHSDKNDSLTHV